MVLSKGYQYNVLNSTVNPTATINQFSIKQVSIVNSLGVHIDENLTWECHINKLSKKSASGISAINVLGIQSYVRLTLHLQFLSVTSTSLLQLGWASCWKSRSQKLEKLQNRAAHIFFKLQFIVVLMNCCR